VYEREREREREKGRERGGASTQAREERKKERKKDERDRETKRNSQREREDYAKYHNHNKQAPLLVLWFLWPPSPSPLSLSLCAGIRQMPQPMDPNIATVATRQALARYNQVAHASIDTSYQYNMPRIIMFNT